MMEFDRINWKDEKESFLPLGIELQAELPLAACSL